ncbi:hypothetical protein [Winogradskyella sp. 3972H.M.0a.05]|uniref:hypothetical protein n=1 Tax=Winogradskyella sp. 3972H.M.0a.05 TaxID=2950277 RepID=UPI0033987776
MKHLLKLALVLFLSISMLSCSDDNNPSTQNPPTQGQLVQQITRILEGGSTTVTTVNYSDQNKYDDIYRDGNLSAQYTYTNDLMTTIDLYASNGNLAVSRELVYNENNELIRFIVDEGAINRYEVSYDETGDIVTLENYYTNAGLGIDDEYQMDIVLEFSNDNLIRRAGSVEPFSVMYDYDNKNAVRKNIFGRDVLKIVFFEQPAHGENNITQRNFYSNNFGTFLYSESFEITYDDNDYPLEVKEFDQSGTLDRTYLYEY